MRRRADIKYPLSDKVITNTHFLAVILVASSGVAILIDTLYPSRLSGKAIKPEELIPLIKSLFPVFQWLVALSIAIASVSFGMVRAMDDYTNVKDGARVSGIYFMRNAIVALIGLVANEYLASYLEPYQSLDTKTIMHYNWSPFIVTISIIWVLLCFIVAMNTMFASIMLSKTLWAEPFNRYFLMEDLRVSKPDSEQKDE